MAYKKPKGPVKKGKGPSRSQQRAGLADRAINVWKKSNPGKRITGQMKKDLTRIVKDDIRENPRKVREWITNYYKGKKK